MVFDDRTRILALPTPIAEAADLMMREIEESGEETTADETALVVEQVFRHLGCLWMSEYLHAAADNPALENRQMTRRILTSFDRPLLTGQWVSLARDLRSLFENTGVSTFTEGLATVDFGTFGDRQHRVARLLEFRNRFGHGSFSGLLQEIRLHRELLDELLSDLPSLWTQGIFVLSQQTGETYRADGTFQPAPCPAGALSDPVQPVMVSSDQSARMSLYPALYLKETETERTLALSADAKDFDLFGDNVAGTLRDWHDQYEAESHGYGAFYSESADDGPIPGEVHDFLLSVTAEEQASLILVEAHPGCAKHRVLDAVVRNPKAFDNVDHATSYRVVADDMPQSANTFCYFLLRQIETVLGEEPGSRGDHKTIIKKSALLDRLNQGIQDLKSAQKRVLVAVGDLHLGADPARGEHTSILDVYAATIGAQRGNHLTIVATTHPGATRERIPYDRRVFWPVPQPDALDLNDLTTELQRLSCDRVGTLNHRVIEHLASHADARELFDLCDALDDGQDTPVFEPAVERALWDLRPVLTVEKERVEAEGRTEVRKVWGVYSPAVATALHTLGVVA